MQGVHLDNLIFGIGPFEKGPLTTSLPKKGLVFIRGGNGSGKTTLLKTLSGHFRTRRAGEIRGLENGCFSVGIYPLFFPHWSFAQNLRISRNLWGTRKTRSVELLNELSAKFKNKTIDSLSTGLRRQLELATAFHFVADALLLDEALDPLDQTSRGIFGETLREIAKTQLLVMTSHHESDLPFTPDQVIEL